MFDRTFYRRGINIHANRFHVGRQHACDGEGMLECREQHYMTHVSELPSHNFLSFDHVRCYAGNRSLVPNSTGEHDIDFMPDAGVENASSQNLLLHGRGDPARFANRVDGAQMVLVSTSCEGEVWIHS